MSVRRQRACNVTLSVTKFFGERPRRVGVTLHREDNFIQNKSILYSKMKSIEKGNIKLPVPLISIKPNEIKMYSFKVLINGSIELMHYL